MLKSSAKLAGGTLAGKGDDGRVCPNSSVRPHSAWHSCSQYAISTSERSKPARFFVSEGKKVLPIRVTIASDFAPAGELVP